MKTLIVSPTYNESKNIADLIEHIFTLDKNYHLLIVDDNSPDGTAELVEKFQKRYSNLHLKKRPGKAGLGTAYKFGFKWALLNEIVSSSCGIYIDVVIEEKRCQSG